MKLTVWEQYLIKKKDTDELFDEVIQKCKELKLDLIVNILTFLHGENLESQFIFKYFKAIYEGEFWLLENYQLDEIYYMMVKDDLNCLYRIQEIIKGKNNYFYYSEEFYEEITMQVFNGNTAQSSKHIEFTLSYLKRIANFLLVLKEKKRDE